MIGSTELTRKEIELLTMYAAGLDRVQIAKLWGCTKSNIKYYFQNINKKARRAGLIQNIKGNSALNSLPLMEKYKILERAKQLGEGYWIEYEHVCNNPAPKRGRGEHVKLFSLNSYKRVSNG